MRKSILIISIILTSNSLFCQFFEETNKIDTIFQPNREPFNSINWQEAYRNRNPIILRGDYSPSSTSVFLNKNFILTAAHNVHTNFLSRIDWLNIQVGKYKQSYRVEGIEINGRKKFTELKRVPKNYSFAKKPAKRIDWDFALIYIPDELLSEEFKSKWKKSFYLDKQYKLKKGDSIYIAGYPAGKTATNSDKYDGDYMIYQKGIVSQINQKHFYHNFYTEKGSSGSPIWVINESRRIIVGIHTFPNKATMLDNSSISLIEQWIALFEKEN
tara:strand:- start:163 stop:975 length:813 start_codon:yes stop_codon:yes gene_type:complete